MAFVLFLRVCWICLPFFTGLSVSNAREGAYRLQAASRNLADHQDDFSNSLSFDEGTEQVSRNKPSSQFYTSFSKPSMTQPQNLAVIGQNPPNKLSALREKAGAGGSMKWESKLLEPISSPSHPDNKVSLVPAAIQSQLTPLDSYTNREPVSRAVAGTSASSKKLPSKAFTSLSMQSWPAESQTGDKVGVSTVSFPTFGRGSSKTPKLSLEGAFHYNSGNAGFSPDRSPKWELPLLYPSVHTKLQDDDYVGAKDYGEADNSAMWSPPSYRKPSTGPALPPRKPSFQSTGVKSSAKDRMMVSPFSGAGRPSRWPQNLVTNNQKIKVLERVSQPTLQSLLKKRIVHTKNGYRRGRVLVSKTAYSPEYEVSQKDAMAVNSVDRPAQDSETWRKY